MKLTELIYQPEGRRLEFKEKAPGAVDLIKTIVAFANDAGGDLFLGIKDKPREIVGIKEDKLIKTEEQISSLIHDNSYPVIIPDISFHSIEKAHFVRIKIYRGSNLPYFIKSKGKMDGTYIRVGSTNRKADAEIIAELERQKRNVSFDSELVHGKPLEEINIEPFGLFYQEKTDEAINKATLKKLELLKDYQGSLLPTNAYILFSENPAKKEFFPYAKIECARFKGITTEEFIDRKTIDGNISIQSEAAYEFILRHINKAATVKGVYTTSRWEYPVIAIREVIRNAVVHRDYSLSGKDIKVAVYDDMVEITSPGKLMPSIDFNELDARQSDIRNKIIAPVFKKLGLIDQWGNGLKLISDELKNYPNIEFKWFEQGLQFQVQFVKKNYSKKADYFYKAEEAEDHLKTKSLNKAETNIEQSLIAIGTKLASSWHQVSTKLAPSWHQVEKLLKYCGKAKSTQEMMMEMGWKDRTKFRNKYVIPLLEEELLEMTIPEKPNSPGQQYYLTGKGEIFLKELTKRLKEP